MSIIDNDVDGIWMDDADFCRIYDNIIEENNYNGIHLGDDWSDTDDDEDNTDNFIYNNTIRLNGGGIYIFHSNNNRFYDNDVENNIKYGLRISYTEYNLNLEKRITIPWSEDNYIYVPLLSLPK